MSVVNYATLLLGWTANPLECGRLERISVAIPLLIRLLTRHRFLIIVGGWPPTRFCSAAETGASGRETSTVAPLPAHFATAAALRSWLAAGTPAAGSDGVAPLFPLLSLFVGGRHNGLWPRRRRRRWCISFLCACSWPLARSVQYTPRLSVTVFLTVWCRSLLLPRAPGWWSPRPLLAETANLQSAHGSAALPCLPAALCLCCRQRLTHQRFFAYPSAVAVTTLAGIDRVSTSAGLPCCFLPVRRPTPTTAADTTEDCRVAVGLEDGTVGGFCRQSPPAAVPAHRGHLRLCASGTARLVVVRYLNQRTSFPPVGLPSRLLSIVGATACL